MQNYIAPGENITVPAPADVKSGDLVVVGSLVGVASTDAASGDDVVISTDGIFELPKKTTDVVGVGRQAVLGRGQQLPDHHGRHGQ